MPRLSLGINLNRARGLTNNTPTKEYIYPSQLDGGTASASWNIMYSPTSVPWGIIRNQVGNLAEIGWQDYLLSTGVYAGKWIRGADKKGILNHCVTRIADGYLNCAGTNSGHCYTDSDITFSNGLSIVLNLQFSESVSDLAGIQSRDCFYIRRYSSGVLQIQWTDINGVSHSAATDQEGSEKHPAPVNTNTWVKFTITFSSNDSHVIGFYHSSDGVSWEVIKELTRAGVTSIRPSTSVFGIGSDGRSVQTGLSKIYKAIVKDGDNGATLINADFTNQPEGTTSFVEATGKTVTISSTGSGWVRQQNDSTGNLRHLTQTNTSPQPRICNNGVVDVFGTSGIPAPVFNGVDHSLFSEANLINPYSISILARQTNSGSTRLISSRDQNAVISLNRTSAAMFNGGTVAIVNAINQIGITVANLIVATESRGYINNVDVTTNTSQLNNWGRLAVGARADISGGENFAGQVGAIIVHNNNISANRTALNNLLNSIGGAY